jgi:hypothetical protein
MIKNLFHAVLGAIAFFGLGWLVIQPSQVRWMAHHKDPHYALAGALIVLALFVIVSLAQAFRRKPASSPARTTPYATTGRRR